MDVLRRDEIGPKALVAGEPRHLKQFVHLGRIVFRIDIERVARLIGRRRAVEDERQMPGLLAGLRRVEIDVLDDLGFDDLGLWRGTRLAEIHRDDGSAAGIGRRQRLDGAVDPVGGGGCEIEIAIDAIDHALAAERRETLIERLADGAELDIGRVAQRQHGEFDAVEPRRVLAHQLGIDARGARGRLALAPGGGDHDEALGLRQIRQVEVGHIDDRGLEPVLARGLGEIAREMLGIARLACVNDRQRLGRNRRSRRLRRARRGFDAGQKSGKPGALHRARRADHAIEELDLLVGKRRGLRDRRNAHDAVPTGSRAGTDAIDQHRNR